MGPANILITGASGYLGSNILAQWSEAGLPPHGTSYALVRSDKHATDVESQGFTPIRFDAFSRNEVEEAITSNNISIVVWLVDAFKAEAQTLFIDALAKVKKATGSEVHFIHTSGAKIFSSHAGFPTEPAVSDDEAKLNDIQESQKATLTFIQPAIDTNNLVITKSEALGVRSYIFIPCIVYGKSRGLGNPVSIQTVAIIKSARAVGRVCRIDRERTTWPVSHVTDTANLYLSILKSILEGEDIGYGRNGYYLASSGNAAWDDIYSAMAASLHRRGAIESADVTAASNEDLEKMGQALNTPQELVPLQLSGHCTLAAAHGKAIGWQPKFNSGHLLEEVDEEVERVLKHVENTGTGSSGRS